MISLVKQTPPLVVGQFDPCARWAIEGIDKHKGVTGQLSATATYSHGRFLEPGFGGAGN